MTGRGGVRFGVGVGVGCEGKVLGEVSMLELWEEGWVVLVNIAALALD
jgi:hypothetical protein